MTALNKKMAIWSGCGCSDGRISVSTLAAEQKTSTFITGLIYIAPDTVAFEKETGIKVSTMFSTPNEVLEGKLMAGSTGDLQLCQLS